MKTLALLHCLSLLLLSLQTIAGNDQLPCGARSAGMGNASLCLEDASALFNNQAALAFLKKPELAVNYENPFLLKEIQLAGVAYVVPLHTGVFGLSVSSFGSTVYQENTCGIAYALALVKSFSASSTRVGSTSTS